MSNVHQKETIEFKSTRELVHHLIDTIQKLEEDGRSLFIRMVLIRVAKAAFKSMPYKPNP